MLGLRCKNKRIAFKGIHIKIKTFGNVQSYLRFKKDFYAGINRKFLILLFSGKAV